MSELYHARLRERERNFLHIYIYRSSLVLGLVLNVEQTKVLVRVKFQLNKFIVLKNLVFGGRKETIIFLGKTTLVLLSDTKMG